MTAYYFGSILLWQYITVCVFIRILDRNIQFVEGNIHFILQEYSKNYLTFALGEGLSLLYQR